jgi:endoglucanase
VVIHTAKGPVKGVVGKKAIHLMKKEDRDKPPELKDLWIDIGVDSDKKAKKLVAIGDPITYADELEQIRGDLYVARGVDDRIGAFVVGEVIRYLKGKKLSAAVYSVATVQEEIGLRGARTSAFGVDPTVAFAVDVTHANGPGVDKRLIGDVELGKGCVVERGANFNNKLFDLVMTVAKKQKIDAQVSASPGGTGTDANAIQLTRAGVATSLISVPTRYMHTPVEMFHLHDVECTVKLIAETILTLTADSDFVL